MTGIEEQYIDDAQRRGEGLRPYPRKEDVMWLPWRKKPKVSIFDNTDVDWNSSGYNTVEHLWGKSITFVFPERVINLDEDIVRVGGHHPRIPKVGDILLAEMQKSWVMFKFIKVDACFDPPDMFFADVKAIAAKMKGGRDEGKG